MEEIKTTTRHFGIDVLREIDAAIKRLAMYPPEHPAAIKAAEKPFFTLQEMFENTDHVTISQVGDKIIINGDSVKEDLLPERLKEEFQEQNINSLTFLNTLTKEELSKFLSFFVKPLEKSARKRSLIEFISKNEIRSIQFNELRYELVSDDEVVVKAEILEGADLKAQISKIIKENPDLVRDILLNKPVKQESCIEKFGTEVNLDQLTQEIQKQVKHLTDDEVLSLLASGLESTLKKSEGEDKNSVVNEVANLVHKLLQDREKKKLLPQVKKILSGYRILDEKYFDLIFEEKWLKSQAVLDELIALTDELGEKEVDFERFMFLLARVIDSEEPKIRLYAMDKLLSNLDSGNSETRRLSVVALKEILSSLILRKMEVEFVYLKGRLYDKIKDQMLSANVLNDSTELVKIIFSEMIQRKEFEEAKKILCEYNVRLSEEVLYSEEVREVAKDFLKEVSDESTLTILINQLKDLRALQNTRVIEEILECLDKDQVAQKLLEIFTVDHRPTRISSLRVLSKLGQSSIAALGCLLSNINAFGREEETQLLIDEHWYKVRNAIYVLGSIPDPSSVEILVKLNSDPDPRVRLEVIKALEKIGEERSVDALLTFLKDKDEEVRKSAIGSLSVVGDRRCLKSLIDHFHRNRKDKISALTAIGKIGGEEAMGFLLELLSKENSGVKDLSRRQKEEIKITALNILGKIGSTSSPQTTTPNLAEEIEKFISQKKRRIRVLLTKDPLTEAAEQTLKMIKSRTQLKY
ncbi:MAG: HEAT repeat domain-containing protein [candidate division Zixibacteria bacterium]|nr:HEAT repeat domain-containing protein [candidate division Zixibacteria bacterium]